MKLYLLLALLIALCPFAGAEEKGWDYYKTILDKGMFPKAPVAPPPGSAAPPPVAPPPPKWEIDYKITTVYEHFKTGEIMIGIQNIKNQRNMLLRQGELSKEEGLKVEKVNSGDQPMTIELSKNGEVHPFEFASSVASLSGSSRPAPAASGGRSTMPSRSSGRGPIRPSGSSYYQAPEKTAQPAMNGAEIEKHLIQYQKEVIKKGLPLLPVGLPDADIKDLERGGFIKRDGR